MKEIFLTAWELDQKVVIDLAGDRAPFIDQTQSMSLNVSQPTSDLMVRALRLPQNRVQTACCSSIFSFMHGTGD